MCKIDKLEYSFFDIYTLKDTSTSDDFDSRTSLLYTGSIKETMNY